MGVHFLPDANADSCKSAGTPPESSRMNRKFVALGVILCSAALCMGADLTDTMRNFVPQHLRAGKGVQLFCPKLEPYEQGGQIKVALKKGIEELTLVNTSEAFPSVSTPEEARELVELLVWGNRIDSLEAFQDVLKIYEQHRFEVRKGKNADDNIGLNAARLFDAPMSFDAVAKKADNGFDVAFTALLLNRGMGASASVERHCYHVGNDGAVTQTNKLVYLVGPCLNWQIEIGGGDTNSKSFLEEDAKAEAKRRPFIEAVYVRCPYRMPGCRRVTKGLGKDSVNPSDR